MAKKKPRPVPAWDDYFMMLSIVTAMRSKDPNTQVGAVIADADHKLVSTGYNGTADGMPDDEIDWSRPAKYPYLIHAEKNAIDQMLAARGRLGGVTLYVTGQPCHQCMNNALHNKVKKIVYGPQQINMVDEAEWEQVRDIAKKGKVELVRYSGNLGVFLDQLELFRQKSPELFQSQLPMPM